MEANQKNPNFVSKRGKYKKKRDRRKLLVGEKVEVRSFEDGFLGSWHSGTVTALEKQARHIRYDHLLSENGGDNVVQTVSVSKVVEGARIAKPSSFDGYRGSIRPPSPKILFDKHDLRYGLCVDVYHVEAWWEGVILDHKDGSEEWKIFFPDLGDVMNVGIDSLRISQDWDEITEVWHQRGTWLVIELIEKHEKENFIPVSMEQLWYDIRVKPGFDEIGEWTCCKRLLWEDLVLEVIQDNLIITIDHFLQELNDTRYSRECFNNENPGNSHAHSEKTRMENDKNQVLPYNIEDSFQPSLSATNDGEDEHIVDTIEAYLEINNRECNKKDLKIQTLKDKVKTHLFAIGWQFSKIFYGRKCLSRYTSPCGKCCVYTLKQACRKYLKSRHSKNEASEVQEIRNLKRKRKSDSPSFRCDSPQQKISSKFSDRIVDAKSRKKSRTVVEPSHYLNDNRGRIRILLPRKRLCQGSTQHSTYQDPRTVLSWLIDNNVIPLEGKIYCYGMDQITTKEGKIGHDGIKCGCCSEIMTIRSFSLHAGKEHQTPAAEIFLEDGRSLLDCQMEANEVRERMEKDGSSRRKWRQGENDDVCSLCLYGGDLLLCDGCPSAYHKDCVRLEDVPDDDWFCPMCFCEICGKVNLKQDICHSKEDQFIRCHQCERECHVSCLPNRGVDNMSEKDKGENWFCRDECKEIFERLQKLVGIQTLVGSDNLTWTLMKTLKSDIANLNHEYESKLNLAVDIMHECFEPVDETQSQGDIIRDVVFSRRRLNFTGFYTILLERNDELIAVAAIRIFGKNAAEIPIVATRFQYRRHGMCRILMDKLEEKLRELGVERLVLPSVRCVLNTWINSFGFSEMTDSERKSLLSYTFLDFQDTVMCHKTLYQKNPLLVSTPSPNEKLEKRNSKEQDIGGIMS
ncbi:PREDICTED: increased DNA methylation 1-like isoform X3 [Tarenaya hassleriana]|uniref:increased DNA methylation 1-like isoform X3 n=1 Tax=Tarenaya hassleriana TaxID=28532 RepID=UPI00053C4282|nr:PREDICTED: increased DNA methylation 1-like isoform X3 [Tarenaya hassleriana]